MQVYNSFGYGQADARSCIDFHRARFIASIKHVKDMVLLLWIDAYALVLNDAADIAIIGTQCECDFSIWRAELNTILD